MLKIPTHTVTGLVILQAMNLRFLALLFLCACAPVTDSLSSTSETVSGVTNIAYADAPWTVINTFADVVTGYVPSGAHGPLRVTYLSDSELKLRATPVEGVRAQERDPQPFTLEVTAINLGEYTRATFRIAPANYRTAQSVRERLIVRLDKRLNRTTP